VLSRYSHRGEAFWRTITADTLYAEQAKSSEEVSWLEQVSWLGQTSGYRRADSIGSAAFKVWMEDDTKKVNRKTAIGPGFTKHYTEPEELTRLKNQFHYAVLAASASRKFFTTDNGYIGIGPADVLVGDEVYVILGSRVPLILRQSRASKLCSYDAIRNLYHRSKEGQRVLDKCNTFHMGIYALVGDAYVHGIMDGEIVTRSALQSSQRPNHVFLA
jgi:hypothetical protein